MAEDALTLTELAAIAPVRAALASGDAVAVFTQDLDRVLGSNRAFAQLFGHRDSGGFREAGLLTSPTAKRQLFQAVAALDHFDGAQNAMIRIASGLRSRLVPARIERVAVADGSPAIAVACAAGGFNRPAAEIAKDLAAEFAGQGAFAFLDSSGATLGASNRLRSLEPVPDALTALAGDPDRVAAGLDTASGRYPATIRAFLEEPAIWLVDIDDSSPLALPEDAAIPVNQAALPGEPPRTQSPFAGLFTVRRPAMPGDARGRPGIRRPYFRAGVSPGTSAMPPAETEMTAGVENQAVQVSPVPGPHWQAGGSADDNAALDPFAAPLSPDAASEAANGVGTDAPEYLATSADVDSFEETAADREQAAGVAHDIVAQDRADGAPEPEPAEEVQPEPDLPIVLAQDVPEGPDNTGPDDTAHPVTVADEVGPADLLGSPVEESREATGPAIEEAPLAAAQLSDAGNTAEPNADKDEHGADADLDAAGGAQLGGAADGLEQAVADDPVVAPEGAIDRSANLGRGADVRSKLASPVPAPPMLNAWSLGRSAQTMLPDPAADHPADDHPAADHNAMAEPEGSGTPATGTDAFLAAGTTSAADDGDAIAGERSEADTPYLADPATDLARWRAEVAEDGVDVQADAGLERTEPDLATEQRTEPDTDAQPPAGSDQGQADADANPATGGEDAAAASDAPISAKPGEADTTLPSGPVRFVWKMDQETRFTEVSPAFAEAVGPNAADVIGRTFRDVATVFQLDPAGSISALLARRDTWSGKSVLWPVQGTDLRVPVDLAALPTYARDRTFEGYRGFGVVRMNDAMVDPEELGLALVGGLAPVTAADTVGASADADSMTTEPAETEGLSGADADPFDGEPPAIAVVPLPLRRASDKVVNLSDRRPRRSGTELSEAEQAAFRTIGRTLGVEPEQAETIEEDAEDAGTPVDTAGDNQATASLAEPDPELPSGPAVAAAEDMAIAPSDALLAASVPSEPETDRGQPGVDTTILARLPVAVLIHSGDQLHYANPEFLGLSGYDSLDDIVAAGGLDALFAEPEKGDGEAEPRRLTLVRGDDGTVPVQAHLQRVRWRRGHALLTSLRPAAPATKAPSAAAAREDDALKERIAELTNILDTATDGVVLINPDGTIRSLNHSAAALFGYDMADVQGKSFSVLFAHESQRAAMDYLAGLSDHGVASVLNEGREVLGRESGGGFIPMFMTIGRLGASGGYCAVLRDITHWKQTEHALNEARREAEAASHQKSDFLARISHEIRTPLNSIIGFSELMAEERFGPIGNERYRDYLNDINRSGRHVLDLVNDLLDISKIEAGKQDLEFEAVSLNDTLLETVSLMQPQANRERVIIRSSFASRLPAVVADQRSVKQIALNVLSNAVRFTPAGGQVIVSTVYERSGDVVLRFRDTGVGMSQKEIELAMKPFRQVSSLGARRNDGTGLGLPLTKALVEANRADFSIVSAPGKGTTVEITFPSTRVLAD